MTIKRRTYWVPKRGSGEVPIAPEVLAETPNVLLILSLNTSVLPHALPLGSERARKAGSA